MRLLVRLLAPLVSHRLVDDVLWPHASSRSTQRPHHGPARRPPAAAEAKALGHPMRLRILFACREQARTNKELARLLGTTPGTIHYHLRPLVEQGFLRPEAPRPGPRGSREQPYRATGKSWEVGGDPTTGDALRQIGAEELLGATGDEVLRLSRLGMSLDADQLAEFLDRLDELIEEFADRSRSRSHAPPGALERATASVTLLAAVLRAPSPP